MGALSDLERRLLAFVDEEPRSATQIWRRFADIPARHGSLTTRMRRQRREAAMMLEDLAAWRWIERDEEDRHGATVPVYFKRPRAPVGRDSPAE